MDTIPDPYKELIKIAGKILFVLGLVLNICMICFGFWPSLIFILIMLVGAGMITIGKNPDTTNETNTTNTKDFVEADTSWLKKSMNTLVLFLQRTDGISAQNTLKNIGIAVLVIFALCISALFLGQDYFKKRDTISSGKEITTALEHYKQGNKGYPADLSVLVNNNPMLSGLTKDKWDNPYQYKTENNGADFILTSSGEDGKFNTADDLVFKK